MRILIVRIGAMGDVLHALPAVAALREQHPDWFIGWAIEPRWSDLLQIAGDSEDLSQGIGRAARPALIDRWYQVPTGRWKNRPFSLETLRAIGVLRRALRDERFDVCVDMQGALKSAVVARLAGAGLTAGMAEPRERVARWLYRDRVPLEAAHVIEQGCELLGAAVGETLRPARVPLPMGAAAELCATRLVGFEGARRFCLISPGAGWGAKMWPAERYGAVAVELGRAGLAVVVNSTGQSDDAAQRVVAASEGCARAVVCSVAELIALTRRAAVVIAGDTGPLHLAAALERPVVGIYGATDPARTGPYGISARVLRDPGSVISHRRVDEPEAGMLRISVEDVVRQALEVTGASDVAGAARG